MSDPLGLFSTNDQDPDPLGLFDSKAKTSVADDVSISFAGVGNTVDKAWSGLSGALAGLFDEDEADEIYKKLQERIKQRQQWANPENKEQGFGGKLTGAVATLPMQIPAALLSPFETGQTMIDQGEKLSTALKGTALDTAGNMVGAALPGAAGKTLLGKVGSGAAINAAQDAAVRLGLGSLAETAGAKEALGPDAEGTAIAALVGAGMGAASHRPAAKVAPPAKDFDTTLKAPVVQDPLHLFDGVPEQHRTNESQQLPLFDQPEQGRMANPYEASIGEWRVDENGIPIRADLSMDVQHVQEPLQRHLWGDELDNRVNPIGESATLADSMRQFEEQPVQGGIPLTQAIDSMDWAHRRGAINSELKGAVEPSGELQASILEATPAYVRDPFKGMGRTQSGAIAFGPKTPKPNTITEPRTPEAIKAKQDLAAKAAALKVRDTAYDRVNTLEEAVAGIETSKDMWKVGANELRSGSEAVLRTNQNNKPVNFVRTTLQKARNTAEVMSKTYVTNKKDGVIKLWKDLSDAEQVDLVGMWQALDRNQVDLTPEVARKLGMTPAQEAVAMRVKEALEHRYANVSKALGEQGFAPFAQRKGYFPSMFSGSYTSLVGYTDSKGKWHTKGIAQADTAWQHKKAVEAYKNMGKEYAETVNLPRKGLNSSVGNSRVYSGFADVVNNLAKYDESFAQAKKIADQHIADQAASLYRFDVHELKKSGVKGSLGDRPWLDQKENTKQMFEGLVDYLEQGFRYDSLQGPLNDIGKLVADPALQSKLPNTAKFIDQHVKKVTGDNLNVIGAAANGIIDATTKAIGVGPKYPRQVVQGLTDISTTLMMGMFNFGFGALQLAQLPQAMTIEGARVRPILGLPPEALAKSATTAGFAYPIALSLSRTFNKPALAKMVPEHIRTAFDWAEQRGMFDYSEAELVHNLNKSKTRQKVEKVANATISVPEKLTRPTMFLFMTDLFHQAGFRGEDAMLRAQAATDYAMVHYHADERPGIYQGLGEAGKALGALSTFKHNFIEQAMSTTMNARKNPEAFAVGLGWGFALYGVLGMPGADEMSEIVQALTGKNIREMLLDDADKPNLVLDGLASYASGVDIQSRVALSNMVPDSPLQATPHVSNQWNILSSAVEAAVKQDEASLKQLAYKAMPSSARNVYEATALTDENGWVRNPKGELKVERPRTQEETTRKALLGLRPLDERLAADNVWTGKQRQIKNDRKLREAATDFANAVRLGSDVRPAVKKYTELGGDPNELFSQIDKIMEDSVKTPKQRAQGEPNDSLSSIRRYQNYNP